MDSRVTTTVPVSFSDKLPLGISKLIEDLLQLMSDTESADVIFFIGADETSFTAHRLILKAR